jgi:hypothetical protein
MFRSRLLSLIDENDVPPVYGWWETVQLQEVIKWRN